MSNAFSARKKKNKMTGLKAAQTVNPNAATSTSINFRASTNDKELSTGMTQTLTDMIQEKDEYARAVTEGIMYRAFLYMLDEGKININDLYAFIETSPRLRRK